MQQNEIKVVEIKVVVNKLGTRLLNVGKKSSMTGSNEYFETDLFFLKRDFELLDVDVEASGEILESNSEKAEFFRR